jgi:hypothetical protein
MSDLLNTSLGYISPVGDFALKNSQALGGVSQLWQDFFASAMQEQANGAHTDATAPVAVTDDAQAEPTAAGDWLAQVKLQRLCDLKGTDVMPAEPLFLPIAEFDLELLDKTPSPLPAGILAEQQQQLDFSNAWLRPLVLTAATEPGEPGPAPRPQALNLPIAEFEWSLADKPATPFAVETIAQQDLELKFDHHWAAPVVLQNLRIAA